MKNFTKEERKQIIKESLRMTKGVLSAVLLIEALVVILLAMIYIIIIQDAQIVFIGCLILTLVITNLFVFIVAFLSEIEDEKKDLITKKVRKKEIEEERKRIDELFDGRRFLRVVPLQYDAYQEFFDYLDSSYIVEYYACKNGKKITVFLTIGENSEKGVKFDEIKKECFLSKYRVK